MRRGEAMTDDLWVQRRINDLKIGFIFLTRLPLAHQTPIAKGELSHALWAAPAVGAAVGLLGAGVYGLADVADGFGGGGTRECKLEMMHDSRIGTFGVCALILSFMLRVSALTNLGDTGLVTIVLIAAHAAGRAPIAAFMRLVPPARTDGMSADAGRPSQGSAMAALLLGLVPLMMALGFAAGVVAVVLLAVGFGFMAWLCKRQIGGQTGDVLGALEQIGEIVVLLVAAAAANALR